MLWTIQLRNWRVSVFALLWLWLKFTKEKKTSFFRILCRWTKKHIKYCKKTSSLVKKTSSIVKKHWALQLLNVAHLSSWLLTPEMRIRQIFTSPFDWNRSLGPSSQQKEIFSFFCCSNVFESIWMCRKVHFKAGVIFHHPVCVASDASLTQNTSLDHFREKYFLLFKCAFEKLNQNSPFGISFGICPHPSQLLPALKHFCQKITLCFQPEFKFLGKHYLSSTILNKFKKGIFGLNDTTLWSWLTHK